MSTAKRNQIVVLAYAAQHLQVGGFDEDEIAKLLAGVPPGSVPRLLELAHELRPKLCQESCPPIGCSCPYCGSRDELDRSFWLQ